MNRWLLVATVALLPLLVPSGPGESAPVDIAAVLYILLALARLLGYGRGVYLPGKGAVALILGASLVATAFSLSVSKSLLSLLIEVYLFVLFVCVANDLRNDKGRLRMVLNAWSLAALFWAAVIIASHVEFLPDGLQRVLLENSDSGGYRVAGASKNPNFAASYLMTSFFVLLASPWPRRRLARLVAAGWLLAGIFVTGSNGAIIGVVVGGIVLVIAFALRAGRTPSQRLGVVGAALVVGGVVLTGVVTAIGLPRVGADDLQALAKQERGGAFGGTIGRLDRSVPGRLEIWTRAWRGAGSRALVGVGPGSAEQIPIPPGNLGRSLHNDYIAFLVERGILGLLGLVSLCIALLQWSRHLLSASSAGGWRLAGLGGAVIANLTFAASHESFHFRHLWILFGLVWAASPLVVDRLARAEPGGQRQVTKELTHAGC